MPYFYYIVLKTEVNIDFSNMDCACFFSTDYKYLYRDMQINSIITFMPILYLLKI